MTRRSSAERRRDTVEACRQLIEGKTYQPGTHDCLKLMVRAVREMGGSTAIAKGARYRTEAGALRELRKRGFDGLADAVDAAGLPRIAPAAALPGDILGLRTEHSAFGIAAAVYAGNGKAVVFAHGVGMVAVMNEAPLMAWRNG